MTDVEIFNKLCVSFKDKNAVDWLQKNPKVCLAEARLDLMMPTHEEIQKLFSLPIRWLATCHRCSLSDEERLELLQCAIVSGAKMVDIAIDESAEFFQTIQLLAKKHHCQSIVSYHNYFQSIDYHKLYSLIQQCFATKADMVKIAYPIDSEKDIETIQQLFQQFDHLIVIGMGEQYSEIRMKILDWGAPFTFVAPNSKLQIASGQWAFEKAVDYFRKKSY